MDNKSLTESIFQPSEPSISSASLSSPSLDKLSSNNTESTGIFDSFKNISLTTWVLIILILAFLGFNIFIYLAKGTQDITGFFGPFLQKIFGTTLAVTGETIDTAAEGGKAVVGGTANIVNTGLTEVQNITPNTASSSIKTEPVQQTPPVDNNTLNKALNSAQVQNNTKTNEYEADTASSSIQGIKTPGWCYIGEDRGFRSCAQVGVNDECMSGDIFPSQEICINPNLRP